MLCLKLKLADESPYVSDPHPVVGEVRESAAFREAFRSLGTVDIGRICSRRAAVMRSPPQFFEGRLPFGDSCCDEGNRIRCRS